MLNIKKIDHASFLVGRTILGLYFFIFGFAKLFTYHDIGALMLLKGVPLSNNYSATDYYNSDNVWSIYSVW